MAQQIIAIVKNKPPSAAAMRWGSMCRRKKVGLARAISGFPATKRWRRKDQQNLRKVPGRARRDGAAVRVPALPDRWRREERHTHS
jgi:hypothetical protein